MTSTLRLSAIGEQSDICALSHPRNDWPPEVNIPLSYNEQVRRHFADPKHAGDLQGAFEQTLCADVSASDKGPRAVLAAGIRDGTIAGLAFRAWGCPYLIAALESLCTYLASQPVASLENYDLVDITRELAVPPEKMGRILLLEDALAALWAQYGAA